jgi:hypothetical protein
VIGDRRKLHNKKLHDLYFSLNNIGLVESRKNRWLGHSARIARSVIIDGFVGKLEGKKSFERPRRRW